jgi:hypothetical protein
VIGHLVRFIAQRCRLNSRPEIRFCKSRDGTRIAYAIAGKGPPLLWAQQWVHHLDLDWDSPIWRGWLELLS